MSKFARAMICGVALSLVVTIVVATADPNGNSAANQLKVALMSFPIWVCAAYQVARIWDSGASGTTRFVAIVSFVAACLLIVASSPSVNSDGLGALDVLGVSGALLVLLATIRNVTAIRDTDAVDPT